LVLLFIYKEGSKYKKDTKIRNAFQLANFYATSLYKFLKAKCWSAFIVKKGGASSLGRPEQWFKLFVLDDSFMD